MPPREEPLRSTRVDSAPCQLALYLAEALVVTMVSETVFVAGAGGLVGSHTVAELVAHGHSVRCLVRRPEQASAMRHERVETVVGDLSRPGDWARALVDVSAVVDATQVRPPGRFTVARAIGAAEARIRMTRNLLAALRGRSQPLGSYVSLSGLEDYATRGDNPFDETAPIATKPRGFAHIGLRVRPVLLQARAEWGLPLVTLRMGLIYGRSGWFPDFVERMRSGRGLLVGRGENYTALVSAHDVARAIRAAIETAPVGREFIVADDTPTRQDEWVGFLAKTLHQSRPLRRVPVFLASLAAGRVNAETFANSKRPSNRRMKEELHVVLRYPSYREGFVSVLASL